MQLKRSLLPILLQLTACVMLTVGVRAQTPAKAADVAGTWSWTMQGRNGGEPRKLTLKLKVEGEKLTGELTSPGRQGGDPVKTEISEGKVKGSEISFTVVREFNGNKMTSKYQGKVEGDTIKGKSEFERNGQPNSRDWEAKRETEKK